MFINHLALHLNKHKYFIDKHKHIESSVTCIKRTEHLHQRLLNLPLQQINQILRVESIIQTASGPLKQQQSIALGQSLNKVITLIQMQLAHTDLLDPLKRKHALPLCVVHSIEHIHLLIGRPHIKHSHSLQILLPVDIPVIV